MSTVKERRAANEQRRKIAAEKQKPLPMEEQQARAEANRAAHQARYPHPPKLDPYSQVAGDPRLRGETPPPRPPKARKPFADMFPALAAMHLATIARRFFRNARDKQNERRAV